MMRIKHGTIKNYIHLKRITDAPTRYWSVRTDRDSELDGVTQRTPRPSSQDRAKEEDADLAGVAWRRTPGSDDLEEEDSDDLGAGEP